MSGLLLGLVSAAVTFLSPGCGGSVSGTINLKTTSDSAPAARVTFAMGSHLLGSGAVGSGVNWNSAEAMDGVSAIQAVAADAFGNELGSAECLVTVSNRQASLVVNAPDLGQPLSGVVSISVTASDALAFPAVWTLNVDGEGQSTVWTDSAWKNPNTVSFSLDTTRFSNGPHELHISMDSRKGPQQPQWMNWRGMVNRVVRFENGGAWMDVVPSYQSLHLAPGEAVAAGCRRWYTDGATGLCSSPSYQADDPAVAAVDTATGVVTGEAAGFTMVTVRDGPKSSTLRVWVAADAHVPRFAARPFVIAPFFLDPDLLRQNNALHEQVSRGGVNTLGHGVYLNPRDLIKSFGDWKADYDALILPKMQWARDNGFYLLPTGDDIFRRIGPDAWFTLNWPPAQQAVEYAANALAATGVGIGIEAIDEASMMWGARPAPEGHIGRASYLFDRVDCAGGNCTVNWNAMPFSTGWSFALQGAADPALNTPAGSLFRMQTATTTGFQFAAAGTVSGEFAAANSPNIEYLWFAGPFCANATACNPPVPNDALATMRAWLTAVPISFPPLATDSAQTHGNWMGPGGISDYASNYFTSLKARTTYPWSAGIQEDISSMEIEFFSRQPYLMVDRPQLMLVSLAGPLYTKKTTNGGVYVTGVDSLTQPGVSPEHVSALMMDAAALGGAGIRLYYFEPAENLANRTKAAPGTAMQTGANPFNLQTASWQAMGYAANLLTHVLEPYLQGTALNSPAYARNLTSAVRQAAGGKMLLIVNGNDWERSIAVDLTPYQTEFDAARYRVRAAGISTDALTAKQTTDSLTLSAGESVVYIFPSSAAAMPLQPFILTRHRPDARAARYAYIYQSNLEQGAVVKCSNSCAVWRDPRLGEFFYEDVPSGRANSLF